MGKPLNSDIHKSYILKGTINILRPWSVLPRRETARWEVITYFKNAQF